MVEEGDARGRGQGKEETRCVLVFGTGFLIAYAINLTKSYSKDVMGADSKSDKECRSAAGLDGGPDPGLSNSQIF